MIIYISVFVTLIIIVILSFFAKNNESFKLRLVKSLNNVAVIFLMPYKIIIASYFVLVMILTYTYSNVFKSSESPLGNFAIEKVLDFESAKQIIPGTWVSKEVLYENQYQYNVLIMKQDGSMLFGQGSSIENATSNATSVKGTWNLVINEERLKDLIELQRFLIDVNLDGIGYDMLRIEIHPGQHQMGRIRNSADELRSSMGLFTFGGKIFYKMN
jgi:hypothetical protein